MGRDSPVCFVLPLASYSSDGLHNTMMRQVILILSALVALTLAGTIELDDEAKKAFVDLHNQYREETGAEMPDLEWDDTLAAKAAEYSSECKFAHPTNNPYGENIYLGWGPAFTTGAAEARKATEKWHTEIDNVDNDWMCIATHDSKTCGHYSQQIWAKTTKIGCAITTECKINGNVWNLVFCEYDPAGNMMKAYDQATKTYTPNPPY